MSDLEATKLTSSERRESDQPERKDAAATQREGGLGARSGDDGSAVKTVQEQRPDLGKPGTASTKTDALGDGKPEALAATKADAAGKQSLLAGVEGNPRLAQVGEKVLGQGLTEAAATLDSVKAKLLETAQGVKQAATEGPDAAAHKADAAKTAVTEKVDAAKTAVTEKVDAAKTAVTEKVDAAKTAVTEKAEAAKQAVTDTYNAVGRKADEAKQAVTEKAEAAKQTYEDAKQKAIQTDHQLQDDKRYTVLKQALENMPIGDPVMYQINKGFIEQVGKSAEDIGHMKDALSDDPAARKAGTEALEKRVGEIYAETYPVGIEAVSTFVSEKGKGASNESAALTAADHAIKYAPFATAEDHFEKAASAYSAGDSHAAAVHLVAGVQSFGGEVIKIATIVEMGAAGAEALAGRGAAAEGARPPGVEAPVEAPKAAAPVEAPKPGVPAESAGAEGQRVQSPGPGQPPVEVVPDKITPEELQKVTVPAETPPGAGRPPESAGSQNGPSQIELDRGPRAPEPALEPNQRDLPQGGDPPGLDTRNQPFQQRTVTRDRGDPSAPEDRTGTDRRTGTAYNERNAAEIVNNLRVEYDPSAGRPVRVSYDVDANTVRQDAASGRSFARDTSTQGAQGTNSAYAGSGYDRGHLAQREAFKGSVETERAADMHTNVVPMAPELNRGAGSPWRQAETATTELAKEKGAVRVEVDVHYAEHPPTLRDGTPIPDSFDRRVIGSDGTVLRSDHFSNRVSR